MGHTHIQTGMDRHTRIHTRAHTHARIHRQTHTRERHYLRNLTCISFRRPPLPRPLWFLGPAVMRPLTLKTVDHFPQCVERAHTVSCVTYLIRFPPLLAFFVVVISILLLYVFFCVFALASFGCTFLFSSFSSLSLSFLFPYILGSAAKTTCEI